MRVVSFPQIAFSKKVQALLFHLFCTLFHELNTLLTQLNQEISIFYKAQPLLFSNTRPFYAISVIRCTGFNTPTQMHPTI